MHLICFFFRLQISLANSEEQMEQMSIKLEKIEQEKKELAEVLEETKNTLSTRTIDLQELKTAFEESQVKAQSTEEEVVSLKLQHDVTIQTVVKEKEEISQIRDDLQVSHSDLIFY